MLSFSRFIYVPLYYFSIYNKSNQWNSMIYQCKWYSTCYPTFKLKLMHYSVYAPSVHKYFEIPCTFVVLICMWKGYSIVTGW